jgi:HEAT repeat protein
VLALVLLPCAPARAQVSPVDAPGADGSDTSGLEAQAELARLPREEFLARLEDVARTSGSEPERAAGLRALGALGGAQDVRLLGRLTVAPDADMALPDLRPVYAAALVALLERHPDALWNVADAFPGAPAGLAARIVDAVRGVPSDARAEALSRMLGARPEVDCQVLAALELVVREGRSASDEAVRRVRARLSTGDARTRQAAALALGALGDVQAIPELIELRREPGGFPSSGARQALREITGLAYDSADAWRAWYAREEAWWSRSAPGVLAELASGKPERVAEILLDLARRRLHRDELARSVGACLARREPDLAVLACAVLQSLGSDAAHADLVRALERDEPSVRDAARAALAALAGPDADAL